MEESEKVEAPWTDAQVATLSSWQPDGPVNVFTCPNNHRGSRVLFPRNDGWHCGNSECDYIQNWTFAHMLKGPPPSRRDEQA